MVEKTCPKCKGEGEIPCQGCSGIARVYKDSRWGTDSGLDEETKEWSSCAKCHGKGVVTCPECKGKGKV